MKQLIRTLVIFLLLIELSSGNRIGKKVPVINQLGTVTAKIIPEHQLVDHSILVAGITGPLDSSYKVLGVLQVNGSLCFCIDSLREAGIDYCNITVVRFGKRIFAIAPHHVAKLLTKNEDEEESIEKFMEHFGWWRIAETELYLSSKIFSKKSRKIPSAGDISKAVGDTIKIEGVQFNRKGALCTHLVTTQGLLFHLPDKYHDARLKKLTPIQGSDENMAYMIYRSENGSSFGIDTLYLGYKDKDNSLNTKEIAQTRWNLHVANSKIENGILTIEFETDGHTNTISQPIGSLENLQSFSNLNDTEKTILDMYKNNQFVYQENDNSKVFHGSVNS